MPSLLESDVVRRVRTWSSARLLRRIHRITHRLPISLRTVERSKVLVVAPHMDDEVIGPGGTLALHRQCGSHVAVVFCAAGATPEMDATRKSEAEAVAQMMEFSDLRFLGYPEGNLSGSESRLSADLAQVVRETWPDQIFCPFPADHHRDHTAAALAVAGAIDTAGWHGEVWSYEVWSPLWPNVAVDISSVVEEKKKAIGMHESQIAGLHYVEGALGLNRYRALRVYVPYAEAFYVGSDRDFARMSALMNSV